MNALGFVEVSGVTAAIDALDIMCKSADVSLVSWERKLGGRLVTLMITGNVSAVKAAVENAEKGCIKKPAATAVIANPHEETVRLVKLSASRIEKQNAKQAEEAEPKPEAAPKPKTTTTRARKPKTQNQENK
ncbi:MAG: BMC domain-containing protein [Clostridia bacterium]|nr:BMC domain-containing protein [Clostridia bacterium]